MCIRKTKWKNSDEPGERKKFNVEIQELYIKLKKFLTVFNAVEKN